MNKVGSTTIWDLFVARRVTLVAPSDDAPAKVIRLRRHAPRSIPTVPLDELF